MKYKVLTFGCRANQADSCELEQRLRAEGGADASLDTAELVIVNTCSVTATAEQAARQAIRRARRLNPTARIVATGCYAARDASELRTLPVSDVLSRDECLPIAFGRTRGSAPTSPVGADPCVGPAIAPPGTNGRTIHLLRVQTGCDEACSYCIVPTTRGRSRSTALDDVVRQVDAAERAGFKQVMLTGVHLGSYGRDLVPARSLAELVARLGAHPSSLRFRISAVEPMDVSADLVAVLAASDRFAHHFHLPLQHASDRLLAAMKRPYTVAEYHAALVRLRRAFPDAALGADVIVGFPSESPEEFEACAAYIARSPLTYLHVFPFSPRPGTAAETMAGRPTAAEVRARVTSLRALGAELNRKFRQQFVGTSVDGLTIDDGTLVLTDNYLRVRIDAGLKRNERVGVRIVADGDPLRGELIGRS
ncbi:MAG: MiaB/RimO family radical SAM methylthiotransferase [Bacteroidales bacterium]